MLLRFAMTAIATLMVSNAALASDEVQLQYAIGSDCPPVSGCYRDVFTRAQIKVKNLGYDKAVDVHFSNSNGQWLSQPASYSHSSADGQYDIFEFELDNYVPRTFAIRYQVNGQTYWDNNRGGDYWLTKYVYDAILGDGVDLADPTGQIGNSGLVEGTILVRNRSYEKVIHTRYTHNNWETISNSYGVYKASLPSGVEVWTITMYVPSELPESGEGAAYAFEYRYPGGSYWDNNFGNDYWLDGDQLSN